MSRPIIINKYEYTQLFEKYKYTTRTGAVQKLHPVQLDSMPYFLLLLVSVYIPPRQSHRNTLNINIRILVVRQIIITLIKYDYDLDWYLRTNYDSVIVVEISTTLLKTTRNLRILCIVYYIINVGVINKNFTFSGNAANLRKMRTWRF